MDLLYVIAVTVHSTLITVGLPVTVLLFLVVYVEISGRLNFERLFQKSGRLQPMVSAAVSAVPGCAGGITLTRLYGVGAVSTGALYAAHIATMGDAAFVLWAGAPLATLGLTLLVAAIGAGLGYFAQSRTGRRLMHGDGAGFMCARVRTVPAWAVATWTTLLAAGLLASGLLPRSLPVAGVGLALLGFSIVLLRLPPGRELRSSAGRAWQTAVRDAAEILAWVVTVDVLFQLGNALSANGIAQVLHGDVAVDVLAAALIGLIPGCGPQIVVATLFVNGDLPFAALLANTLSQHGDALFPILRSRRRLAVSLTLFGGAVGALAGLLWAVRLP